MTPSVLIEQRGSCLEICFNRPDKKNAITREMYAAMAAAMTACDADPRVRSILFAGQGDAFTSGNDLQDFMGHSALDPASPVLAFLEALRTTRKVMIAAVHGVAVGVGATLLLHCDHVVAAPGAAIQFSFVKMALVPEAGSTLLLPRLVGRLKAAELLLLGEPLGATEAVGLGLVSTLAGEGQLLETARAFAVKLDALPPEALVLTRQLLLRDPEPLGVRMDEEARVFRERLQSAEFREAVTAFMQKRAPVFAAGKA